MEQQPETTFTCPWWLLFSFDNPLRRLIHDPLKILAPFVSPGKTVLDVGCGMGYFSIGLAKLTGENGKVFAADLQPEMLAGLMKRADRSGMRERITPIHSAHDSIGVTDPVDFVLAFWMVHEVRRRESFLEEIYRLLTPGGTFLIAEPIIHVSHQDFVRTIDLCQKIGYTQVKRVPVTSSRAILFQK
jgi:ubiquinone/menaquinone biosynthesis C-methylase UbiE